jgi:hypothetical protein
MHLDLTEQAIVHDRPFIQARKFFFLIGLHRYIIAQKRIVVRRTLLQVKPHCITINAPNVAISVISLCQNASNADLN